MFSAVLSLILYDIYEDYKFHAQVRWAWKSCITLGPDLQIRMGDCLKKKKINLIIFLFRWQTKPKL